MAIIDLTPDDVETILCWQGAHESEAGPTPADRPLVARLQALSGPVKTPCGCLRCLIEADVRVTWMVVCASCGNKRCPHANDHRNACTRSNEPGQPGSAYTHPPLATLPWNLGPDERLNVWREPSPEHPDEPWCLAWVERRLITGNRVTARAISADRFPLRRYRTGADALDMLRALMWRPPPECSTCDGTGLVDWEPGAHRDSEEDQQPCPDCRRREGAT